MYTKNWNWLDFQLKIFSYFEDQQMQFDIINNVEKLKPHN